MRKSIWKKIEDGVLTFLPPIVLILIWQWAGNTGHINPRVFPTPVQIVAAFFHQIQKGVIQGDVGISIIRIMKGYVLGGVLGVIAGIILGLFSRAEKATNILIGIIRPIPVTALLPLFILWLGIGETAKTAIITLGSFWPVMINTQTGIKNVDHKLIEVATTLNKTQAQKIFTVIFPYARPYIFTGLRLGASVALSCVVVAEMFAASQGIGYRMTFARSMALPDVMFVGVIVISFVGVVIDLIFLALQKKVRK